MMITRKLFVFGLGCVAIGAAGCALTSKAEVLDVRRFSPEVPMVSPEERSEQEAPIKVASPLRLGRVSASAHLRKYIVFKPSAVEMGIYDDRWWAEAPEEYLRRALVDALFVEDGLAQSLSGASPTLDVELLAFEELYDGDKRKARVAIRFALHDENSVLLAETVTVDRPLEEATAEQLTIQIARALETATDDLAGRVVKKLATLPPPEPTEEEEEAEARVDAKDESEAKKKAADEVKKTAEEVNKAGTKK
jgi:uncharacterized lipoprotein YmbA